MDVKLFNRVFDEFFSDFIENFEKSDKKTDENNNEKIDEKTVEDEFEKEMRYENNLSYTIIPNKQIRTNDKGDTLFLIELPGFTQKDISIEIEDSKLKISGERKNTNIDGFNHLLKYDGISSQIEEKNNFKLSFLLNDVFDKDNIFAKIENGILKVIIKRIEPVKKNIKVW